MAAGDDRTTVRSRIFDLICRYPGMHVRGIQRELDISAPLAQYHLRRLLEEGYVSAREQGGYTRYFPTEKARAVRVSEEDAPIVGLLRETVPLHLVLLLLDHGPRTHAQLVDATALAKSTVSYHLAKLAEAGVVDRVAGTHQIRLVDRDRMHRLLLTFRPTRDLIDAFGDLWEDLYG